MELGGSHIHFALGISIRVGGPSENRPWRVFVAPSGIQKEDMIGDDVFELVRKQLSYV